MCGPAGGSRCFKEPTMSRFITTSIKRKLLPWLFFFKLYKCEDLKLFVVIHQSKWRVWLRETEVKESWTRQNGFINKTLFSAQTFLVLASRRSTSDILGHWKLIFSLKTFLNDFFYPWTDNWRRHTLVRSTSSSVHMNESALAFGFSVTPLKYVSNNCK